jgi:vacuolar protein sorting-associated protein 33A
MHGPFASRVKSMLDMAHTLQPPAATGSSHFERLILIDRMEDPLSMLLTFMTYEGLLDALIGMNHGVVSSEKPATGDEELLTSETERVKLLLNHVSYTELYTVNSETLNVYINLIRGN